VRSIQGVPPPNTILTTSVLKTAYTTGCRARLLRSCQQYWRAKFDRENWLGSGKVLGELAGVLLFHSGIRTRMIIPAKSF